MKKHASILYRLGIICFVCLVVSAFVLSFEVAAADTGVYFVIDKVPIERVEIHASQEDTVQCGEAVYLSVAVFPAIARKTLGKTTFETIEGKAYATIAEDGTLQVSADAPIGATIVVRAIVDGVASDNVLRYEVVQTPVESIEILNEGDEIVFGSSIMLRAKVSPETATDRVVSYSVVRGSEYVQVSYNGVVSFKRGIIPEEDTLITLRAASMNNATIFDDKTYAVKISAFETIDADLDLQSVETHRTYSFNIGNEPFKSIFGDKGVYYSTDVGDDIATIDLDGLLYIKPEAPLGQVINVTIESSDGLVAHSQRLEVVPVYPEYFEPYIVTPPSVICNGESFYLPGDELEMDIASFYPINTSDCNKQCAIRISKDSLATVAGDRIRIADSIEVKDPCFDIMVYTTASDATHSRLEAEPITVKVFIPIASVYAEKLDNFDEPIVSTNVTELEEAQTYRLADLLGYGVQPNNGIVESFEYRLSDDSSAYATIRDNRELIVNDDLPAGETKIGLYVAAKSYNGAGENMTLSSEAIYFDVYKPTREVLVSSMTKSPVSYKAHGDTVIIRATASETASSVVTDLFIVQGEAFVDGAPEYLGRDGQATIWSIQLRNNINQLLIDTDSSYMPIKVAAMLDGVRSEDCEIHFVIPDEDLAVVNAGVERGKSFTFSASHSAQTTDPEIEWSIAPESEGKASVNSNLPYTFDVARSLSAGTEIKIKYRSKFLGDEMPWATATFTVRPLADKTAALIYNGETDTRAFNVKYEKDSKGVIIDKNKPQLWVGRHVTIKLSYGAAGSALVENGLSIDEVYVVCDNGVARESLQARTNDSFKVEVLGNAHANASISLRVRISDGSQQYTLNCGGLSVFRPIQGGVSFSCMTANNCSIKDLASLTDTIDQHASYGINDMTFAIAEELGAIIDPIGIVTVKTYKANVQQRVRYTWTEIYNNQPIERTGESTLELKSVSLSDNGGTGGLTYIIAMPGLDAVLGQLPTRDEYEFVGYTSALIDSEGKVSESLKSGSLTHLEAQWLTLKASWGSGARTVAITKSNSATDTVTPFWNRELLRQFGYTKLKVTITFWGKEKGDGYQYLDVCDCGHNGIETFKYNIGSTGWHEYKQECFISIDQMDEYGTFYLSWRTKPKTAGGLIAKWELGETTVTIEAQKEGE